MDIAGYLFESWNDKTTMWFWFIPLAFLAFYFALKIVKYSSGLIAKTKLNGSFVGVVLISVVTSIPELVSQVIQSKNGNPSVAISNDLGANAITMLVIAIVSLFLFRNLFVQKINKDSIVLTIITLVITAGLSIVLYFARDLRIGKEGVFLVGLVPIILLLAYISLMVYTYYHEKQVAAADQFTYPHDHSIVRISLLFVGFAFLLICTSVLLNWAVDACSSIYHIDPKSGGGLFLSWATTLPEITAFIMFVRNGFVDAGLGSIFGSNIFNFGQIIIGDMIYNKDVVVHYQQIEKLWYLGMMVTIMLGLFLAFILVNKKIKNRFVYFSFPIGIISTYLIGWTLLIIYLR